MSDTIRHLPIEETDFFRTYVAIADWVWEVVERWPELAQRTVGSQLIRAADSVGANLVEDDGRYTAADGLHFLIVARASARETRYWIERAIARRLIPRPDGDERIALLAAATRQLNGLIRYRRSRREEGTVREPLARYSGVDDPFVSE